LLVAFVRLYLSAMVLKRLTAYKGLTVPPVRGKPSAPTAKKPAVAGTKATTGPKEIAYRVLKAPHLGLNLKVGHVYPLARLIEKCSGDKSKVAALKTAIQKKICFSKAETPTLLGAGAAAAEGRQKRPRPQRVTKDTLANEAMLKVLAPLNLNLGLRIGQTYTEAQIRQRCVGTKRKAQLEIMLKDPKYFEQIVASSDDKAKVAALETKAETPTWTGAGAAAVDPTAFDHKAVAAEGLQKQPREQSAKLKVLAPLNLNLGLRVGQIYTEACIRQKCAGTEREAQLETMLKDPKYFETIVADSDDDVN